MAAKSQAVVSERLFTQRERLTPYSQALLAIAHIYRTSKPLAINLRTAEQLARALMLLVHGTLERDLRTLAHAARLVRDLGVKDADLGNGIK